MVLSDLFTKRLRDAALKRKVKRSKLIVKDARVCTSPQTHTMRQLSVLFASLCEANKSFRLKLINLRAHAYVDMATTRLAELYVG